MAGWACSIQQPQYCLDEIFGKQRGVAYLSIVDSKSWAVWAAEGPLAADSDSWTLLLWLAQERGLNWYSTVSDGGNAMAHALQTVDPAGRHQRDIWHTLVRRFTRYSILV